MSKFKQKIKSFADKIDNIKLQKKFVIAAITIILIYLIVVGILYGVQFIELGEINNGQYTQMLINNLTVKAVCFGVIFAIVFVVIYVQNVITKGIIKAIAKKEEIELKRLPNKSIALLFAAIFALFTYEGVANQLMYYMNSTSFLQADPIFLKDIGYYVFQRPFLTSCYSLLTSFILLTILYILGYYICAFGYYFKGIDTKYLKSSGFLKHNIINVAIVLLLKIWECFAYKEDILFSKLNINNDSVFGSLMGSGFTDVTIKLPYMIALPFILIALGALTYFIIRKKKYKKLIWVPVTYFVIAGLVYGSIAVVQFVYVKPNELTVEKKYMQYHLDNTKKAYDINTKVNDVEITDNITKEDLEKNSNVINNIDLLNLNSFLAYKNDEVNDYYEYSDIDIINKKVDDKDRLVYILPKEMSAIKIQNQSYINKTFKYTHGYGAELYTSDIEKGTVTDVKDKIEVKQPRIYYGELTNNNVIVNSKSIYDLDYTKNKSELIEENYQGGNGHQMDTLNKITMSIRDLDFQLLVSNYADKNSKLLSNRNIMDRVKTVLPFLLLDEDPYMIVNDEGNLMWVIDAYTTAKDYPYSKEIKITNGDKLDSINYIRNSIKVLVDPYSGDVNIYITDKTDPVAITYSKMYTKFFKEIENDEVYKSCASHFRYPKKLFDIQVEALKEYYVQYVDDFYKNDNYLKLPKYIDENNKEQSITSYYVLGKFMDKENETFALMQPVTLGNDNLMGYFTGTVENGKNVVTMYKFTNNSTVIGTMQMDQQVLIGDKDFQDALKAIKDQRKTISKKNLILPIDNKLLYIQIYYSTPVEWSKETVIEKVVVSNGRKIVIDDNIQNAINKLAESGEDQVISSEILNKDLDAIIEQLLKTYDYMQEAVKQGQWEAYGREMRNLEEYITKLEQKNNEIKEAEKNKPLDANVAG